MPLMMSQADISVRVKQGAHVCGIHGSLDLFNYREQLLVCHEQGLRFKYFKYTKKRSFES